MKLIRNGVFETNSSSAHSLAYGTSKIIRGGGWGMPKDETDFSNPMYHLSVVPDQYKGYTFYEWLGEYGWNGKTLYSPQQKFSYLLTSIADTTKELHKATEYYVLKEMMESIGLNIEPSDEDEEGYIDHQSYGVVDMSLFKTKEDLITYLFNDNICIHIENDNSEYQEWYTGERNDD